MKKPLDYHSDIFMSELADDGGLDFETLDAFVDTLAPEVPAPELESKLINALPTSRFERFSDDVAAILDIDAVQAQTLLDGVDQAKNWGSSPIEGMTLYHVSGGPKVARAITGFTRLNAGASFPTHKHLGHETVFVLQGYFKDAQSGEIFGPGDIATMDVGSEHGFDVLEGGTGLTYLVVVQEGLNLLGMDILYDSPLM